MKNIYFNAIVKKITLSLVLLTVLFGITNTASGQVKKTFTQRTSQYTPNKKIYNLKGDFTMLGNTNLTPQNYTTTTDNQGTSMVYVDVDGDPNTLNSSSSTLVMSTENGAIPSCSNIVYAGLYWTGKSSANQTFNVTKNNVTKTYNKRVVSLKGPNASSYTTITAAANDIYYPSGSDDNIFSAYAEITDYVKNNGVLGKYTVADIALLEGNNSNPGYSGGWGIIVIYENSKMKWRDVTVFDGYAYVVYTNSTGFTLPVSGFKTAQSGDVDMKLGVMASEGDVSRTGDYFKIQNLNTNNYTSLSHSGNTTNNFFNSSINTGGTRSLSRTNNTGIDISTVDIPNTNNTIIGNSQTSTNFKYGCDLNVGNGDTYSIFMIAMAVDAYVPEVEGLLNAVTVNGNPVPNQAINAVPGDVVGFKVNVKNKGTEAILNTKFVLEVPYTATFVPGSLVRNVYFTPAPTPNNYYFDPSLGPNGSIIWDFGNLPLDTDVNKLLADYSFQLKITEDCAILKNVTCGQSVPVSGSIQGTGAVTGDDFTDMPLIIGYNSTGTCQGEPIYNPLKVNINSTAYVLQNCQDTPSTRTFVFCTNNATIPITEVSAAFPPGSLYYNEYPVTPTTIQYTINNPFPATPGVKQYYAVPPDANITCNFPFFINVTTITTKPVTEANIEYCQGATAIPLTATASNPKYILYYYLGNNNTPQLSITPDTTIAGVFTYYVAEAESGSCIGPKAPITVTIKPQPTQPTIACYETATFNTTTCAWEITGTQPVQPAIACYETATFNTTTCAWDVTGTQPVQPTIACYETATFNTTTCAWDVTGTQPVQPTIACYETATFNTVTCVWDVTGQMPAQPTVACYETATFNTTTCVWDVTGQMPAQPTVACYETATFNTTTCVWDVTGQMPAQPTVACYETATFNTTTCDWDVTGTQPVQPTITCYETATFNTTTCTWDVTGTQPAQPTIACYETATFNTTTCAWDVTGTQPVQPTIACYETATFNTTTCTWDVTGIQPAQPTIACYETATFNTVTCVWDVTGQMPAQPTVACYETATFNTTTCVWDVTGQMPAQPTVACYETATFNTTTCVWDVTGQMPAQPTVACYETATFNTTTCAWDVTGTQPVQPTIACYETATFNTTTCAWDVTGTQPAQPTIACYETATFNTTTCVWDVTGTQPVQPAIACYETATFNTTTCVWDVTGTQPAQPTIACYETATFNTTTCAWDVTGEMPAEPTGSCFETATFNPVTCEWEFTGDIPEKPTVACYETATFNTVTCVWDVTGQMPAQPTVACYETATFNTTTCVWDVTGQMPAQPTVACYETATFNTTTCVWDVTGQMPAQPTVACYETATFNTTTCVWDVTGQMPAQPTVACYETATFNTTTCVWDVNGQMPAQPTVACYETATFNTTTCVWDVTGEMPAQPTVACYETATFNTTTCVWDVTGEMPAQPTVACYETATFNTTTCVWDVTGQMPAQPTVACYETATFNTTTCVWDVTGQMPAQPTVTCYETATFNTTTCVWDVTGEMPAQPTVACYETATFNTTTCVWEVTGTQPAKPTLACYEVAIFNTTTCVWDVTGTQPAQPTIACYEVAIFNTTTCIWDVTGTQASAPTVGEITQPTCSVATGSFTITNYNANSTYIVTPNTGVTIKGDQISAPEGSYTIIASINECESKTSAIIIINAQPKNTEAQGKPGLAKCNEDKDLEVSLTVLLPQGTATGGKWINVSNVGEIVSKDGIEYFKPYGVPVGNYAFKYEVLNGDCTHTVNIDMKVNDDCAIFPCGEVKIIPSYAKCNEEPELEVNLTVLLPEETVAGGIWVNVSNVGELVSKDGIEYFKPFGVAVGNYILQYNVLNGNCSQTVNIDMQVDDDCAVIPCGEAKIIPSYAKCNEEPELEVNLTVLLPEGTITGGIWVNVSNVGELVSKDGIEYFKPYGVTVGNYILQYNVLNGNCLQTVNIDMKVDDDCAVLPCGESQNVSGYADCNIDVDLEVNLTILLPANTLKGGVWTNDNVGELITRGATTYFKPYGVPTGFYPFIYTVENGDCNEIVNLNMQVDDRCATLPESACVLVVHNAFSPNGDGINDVFEIENSENRECFPSLSVEVYNRWGVLVFESNDYNNQGRAFKGISEGRTTINKNEGLPTGTYFYIIQYITPEGKSESKDGYLYLSR